MAYFPQVNPKQTWVLTNYGAVNFFAMQNKIANLEIALRIVSNAVRVQNLKITELEEKKKTIFGRLSNS